MSKIDFNKIKDAVKKRNEFLAEHPSLQILQNEIDELLRKTGNNSYNRQVALQSMMLNTWFRMVKVFS